MENDLSSFLDKLAKLLVKKFEIYKSRSISQQIIVYLGEDVQYNLIDKRLHN